MKHTMKYALVLRALTLLLALALVLGGASLPILAEAEADTEASPYMTWTHDVYLKGYDPNTGSTYSYSVVLSMSSRIRYMPEHYYHYANSATMVNTVYTVTAPAHGSDFLLLDDGTLMATNSGKKALEKLPDQAGGFSEYRLIDGSLSCTVSEDFYLDIRKTAGLESELYSLFELRTAACYTVLGFNEDGWFGVPVGFIFEKDDGLYYASALSLSDDCFDEEGALLPKSNVNLSLIPLDEEKTDEAYDQIRDLSFQFTSNTYEDGSSMFGDILDTPDSTTKGMTYATVIILGLVLPIAPITLGLCLPHSKKLGYKKRWYLLTALGGAWLVLGMLVLIMTLIVL